MENFDALLGRDFDGHPVAEPNAVVLAGLADPRHRERVAPLVEIMRDEASPPFHRLAACTALAGWGERAGYAMVVDTARDPRSAPWYGISVDRRYSVDDTFSAFATALDLSDEICLVKGTCDQRRDALRALVRIADTEYFDGKLDQAFDRADAKAAAADLVATVDRGILTLAAGGRPGFDLVSQLLGLVAVLVTASEPEAVDLGVRLLELDHSPRVLAHAVAVVTRGAGEESKAFGEHLALVGGERTRARVDEALAFRAR